MFYILMARNGVNDMYIAIEGMDGVGKTSLAKKISNDLNINYIEKPMQKFMNCSDEYYNSVCNFMFGLVNQDITLTFYMLGNILTKYLGENIIVDRNILSSYYWDCNDNNKSIFDYFVKSEVLPDLTIILYADAETRKNRIQKRNLNDEDLNFVYASHNGYKKMINYANELDMSYIVLDTSRLNFDEVVNICEDIIIRTLENKEDLLEVCKQYNNVYVNKVLEDENKLSRTKTRKE